MGADKMAKNTPKCPQIYLHKLPAQAQMFGILMKKGFIGRPKSVIWIMINLRKKSSNRYVDIICGLFFVALNFPQKLKTI